MEGGGGRTGRRSAGILRMKVKSAFVNFNRHIVLLAMWFLIAIFVYRHVVLNLNFLPTFCLRS